MEWVPSESSVAPTNEVLGFRTVTNNASVKLGTRKVTSRLVSLEAAIVTGR